MIEHKIKSNIGKIYIGDPCYALNDEAYQIWCDKYDYEDGIFEVGGFNFAIHGTEFGDGIYMGSDGFNYTVDSGCLSAIPIELVNKSKNFEEFGKILETNTAYISYEDENFKIVTDDNEIVIPTGDNLED